MTKKTSKIKAAIVNWLGIPVGLDNPALYDVRSAAGQCVSEQTVLSLSAVWACVKLISEAVGSLPLQVYERTSDGRKLAKDHNLYRILHDSPNSFSTAATYREALTAAVLLRGNGLSEKLMIGNRLVGLKFLPWSALNITQDLSGKTVVQVREDNGTMRTIPWSRIFHVAGFSMDGQWGMSAIAYGAGVFGSALAANSSANEMFEKGLAPKIAFKVNEYLKKGQREEFRENFRAIVGAVNAGEPALLEGGMDAKTIGINPRDAQLLESRSYSVEEVCRWFGVDPSMVGAGNKDSNWGTGLEQKMIGFLTFTLRPWLNRIESAINKQLLSPEEQQRYYVEFNIEGLLRADSTARANLYSTMVNNGIMTRDEVRNLENLPLMGGNASVLTVQTAMAPIDTIGADNDAP